MPSATLHLEELTSEYSLVDLERIEQIGNLLIDTTMANSTFRCAASSSSSAQKQSDQM